MNIFQQDEKNISKAESTKMKLRDSIFRWHGTKFWNGGRTKEGVDCAGLIAEIYKEIGIISAYDDRIYPFDWYKHTQEQILLDSLIGTIRKYLRKDLEIKEVNELDCGDIFFVDTEATGRYNHCGIYIIERIIFHALPKKGCSFDVIDRFEKKEKKFFSIVYKEII